MPPEPRRTKLRRRLSLALVSIVLAAVAAELALRELLFGAHAIGWRVRRPGLYAHHQASEEHFVLQHRFGLAQSVPPHLYHPQLGWVSTALASRDPQRLVHRALASARGRHVVLLYGDSYAHGTTPPGERIEDHFEAVDGRGSYRLLNHGVAGYGLDQIVLLGEATLDAALAELEPEARVSVVLGVYVDDDLDRCALALRGWPKPWFELDDGELQLAGVPVPLVGDYLRARPLAIDSYLARRITHAPGLWPRALHERWTGLAASRPRKESLVGPLVERFATFVRARPVEAFALVFEGEARTRSVGARDWRDEALASALAASGLSALRSGDALRAAAAAEARPIGDYFGREGPTLDHFDGDGNRVVAAALFAELERRAGR